MLIVLQWWTCSDNSAMLIVLQWWTCSLHNTGEDISWISEFFLLEFFFSKILAKLISKHKIFLKDFF
jgi:hypothetical protein